MSDEVVLLPQCAGFPAHLNGDGLMAKAADWFGFDVANGGARQDTIDSYLSGLKHWLSWCRVSNVDPGHTTVEHVKMFRKELVDSGAASSTINSKLTALRRFYDSALQRGLIQVNPVKGIKAPKDRSASADIVEYLSDDEANRLFRMIPNDGRLKTLRDRALIALMTIEGLRRVEVHRANDEDITVEDGRMRMLIHGKGRDRIKYPRQSDVAKVIDKYIEKRGAVLPDANGYHPLFVEVTKGGTPQGRLSRRGITKIVSGYFLKCGITRAVSIEEIEKSGRTKRQRNCHSLRHTCGTDIYRGTKDLKLVQETLGHATIGMAAKYSHVDKRAKSKVTEVIPIEID